MRDDTSRRRVLEIAGSVGTITFLAGCSGESDDGDDGTTDGSTDNGSGDDGSTNESTDDGSTNETTDDDSTNETNGEEVGSGVDPAEWEDVSTIHFESDGVNWNGVAPEMIADQENPTIVLFEGNEYEFIYENGDGGRHNLALWNEDQSVVDDYSTEIMRDEGEQLSFTAEATSEIANYVCEPHSASMIGDVQIE